MGGVEVPGLYVDLDERSKGITQAEAACFIPFNHHSENGQ
jgi:hypothetical protein